MHLTVFAMGTQGDVQPFVALAGGLRRAGHVVRVLTHDNFEPLVRSHGLDFVPARGNVQEVAQSEEMRRVIESGNFLAINAQAAKHVKRIGQQWTRDALQACEGSDLLVAGIGGLFVAAAVAEKLRLPLVQAHVVPFTPTAAFPAVLFPSALSHLGPVATRLSHEVFRQIMWQSFRAADHSARKAVLGLPPAPFLGPYRSPAFHGAPTVYGISPKVLPRPRDWARNVHLTGFWFLDAPADWTSPPGLEDFLAAGPPPVSVGFGSMGDRNPQQTARIILEAADRAERRLILLSGWAGPVAGDLPKHVFVAESVPHAWLFPRVAAVVHHGGAGTTAAGLRAGVPSVIVPFFGDQPFWGRRVEMLGVGPRPIPRKQLTADNLAAAIVQATTDKGLRERAARLGSRIRTEDGPGAAAAVIEAFAASRAAS